MRAREIISTNISFDDLVQRFRHNLETKWDWHDDKMCFKGSCSIVAQELANYLQQHNINAFPVHGVYYGASEEFYPDMDEWDIEDQISHNEQLEHNGYYPYNHWWVEVEGMIIDITADQFHPGNESEYRIVITNTGDNDYES